MTKKAMINLILNNKLYDGIKDANWLMKQTKTEIKDLYEQLGNYEEELLNDEDYLPF